MILSLFVEHRVCTVLYSGVRSHTDNIRLLGGSSDCTALKALPAPRLRARRGPSRSRLESWASRGHGETRAAATSGHLPHVVWYFAHGSGAASPCCLLSFDCETSSQVGRSPWRPSREDLRWDQTVVRTALSEGPVRVASPSLQPWGTWPFHRSRPLSAVQRLHQVLSRSTLPSGHLCFAFSHSTISFGACPRICAPRVSQRAHRHHPVHDEDTFGFRVGGIGPMWVAAELPCPLRDAHVRHVWHPA